MSRVFFWVVLMVVLGSGGCGDDAKSIIVKTIPENGRTSVDPATKPQIQVASGAGIDAAARKVVLYDVTGGAQKTVPGIIEITNSRFTYVPEDPLAQDHTFVLEMKKEAITGEQLDEVDTSQWPDEPLTWPYRLWFSTQARPRVRAAYLRNSSNSTQIFIYFSEPMDLVATGPEIQVLDSSQAPVEIEAPTWIDEAAAKIQVKEPLDPATPYTLIVDRNAKSAGNVLLDGNDNGVAGEAEDTFSAPFTGSQTVIVSRLEAP